MDFLEEARLFAKVKKEKSEIISYVFKSSYWSVLSKLPKRSMETLYLPEKVLKGIINDIERFFNKEELYHRLGIPYKRNYLLEGIRDIQWRVCGYVDVGRVVKEAYGGLYLSL